MARIGNLNIRKIESAVAAGKAKNAKGKDTNRLADGGGLYLSLNAPKHGSWVFRFKMKDPSTGQSREQWPGFGVWPDVTLEQAREIAAEYRKLIKLGKNPLVHKREVKSANEKAARQQRTVRQCASEYIDGTIAKDRKAKTTVNWGRNFKLYINPVIGDMLIGDVEGPDVLRFMEQHIVGRKGTRIGGQEGMFWRVSPHSADKAREQLGEVIGWAMQKGYRSPGPNPADWENVNKVLKRPYDIAPSKANDHILHYTEVPAFIAKLEEEMAGQWSGGCERARLSSHFALRLIMQTGCRIDEVVSAPWDEIDLTNAVWTIAAERRKGRKGKERPHRVPLTPRAIELLQAVPRESGSRYIFPGRKSGGPISGTGVRALMKKIAGDEHTVHNWRKTFIAWGRNETTFDRKDLQMCLSHVRHKDDTTADSFYDKSDVFDKRRRIHEAWDEYMFSPPGQAGATVTPIKRRA